jgi:hypothetical protein
MPRDESLRNHLSGPPFSIGIYKNKPGLEPDEKTGGKCWNLQKTNVLFEPDEVEPFAGNRNSWEFVYLRGPQAPDGNLEQYTGEKFKVASPATKMISAVDYDGSYAVLFVFFHDMKEVRSLGLSVGPRHFQLYHPERDECGSFMFKLHSFQR